MPKLADALKVLGKTATATSTVSHVVRSSASQYSDVSSATIEDGDNANALALYKSQMFLNEEETETWPMQSDNYLLKILLLIN